MHATGMVMGVPAASVCGRQIGGRNEVGKRQPELNGCHSDADTSCLACAVTLCGIVYGCMAVPGVCALCVLWARRR